jgi:nucleotide-binding universal stress UspA family protein
MFTWYARSKEDIMYKNILLCTDGSPAADVAAEYAVWFAKKLHAHVHALYITDIRVLEGPMLSDLSGALGAQPYTALLPQLQQIQREKAAALLAAARKRCEDAHVSCQTAHETGSLVQIMLDYEKRADMVALGQRGEHAKWSGGMLGSSVERMVTPEKFRPIKHMLLAYDGSVESNKALHAVIDLAVALGADVTIVTVCQRENEEAASKVLKDAQQQALDHKLNPGAQLVHGNPETEILNQCQKTGADLIVMGAYGHTRIRELIIGSTTSHVLRKAAVPVLLTRS